MTTPPLTAEPNEHRAHWPGHVQLVWAIVILTLLMRAGGTYFAFLNQRVPIPAELGQWQGRWELVSALGWLSPLIVGILITLRQPRNLYGWVWLLLSLASALLYFPQQYAIYGLVTAPGSLPLADVSLLIPGFGWSLTIASFSLIVLLFPTGRFPSRRWHVVGWALMIAALVLPSVSWARPERSPFAPVENPFGVQGLFGEIAGVLSAISVGILFAAFLPSAISPFVRFRRAVGVERQQLKWFAYAAALWCVMGPVLAFGSLAGAWYIVFNTAPLVFLPAAIGVAILRYRLYDIDIIIRRTLVYSLLTLTLVLVYIGCIVLSRTLVAPVTGGSELAIVASTLVIAALFTPLRRHIQNLIDRRFYRSKYDAAKVLAAFGVTARDETDLERLTSELRRVVDETMQPEFVGLWLREPHSDRQRGRL